MQDNLHQPQYVEKLEKVIRFLIKEKVLSMEDLDDIWAAQIGQHEAIVKNVHDLLAKLAWDFTPPQMDHLFERFQSSWSTANAKQREKLLELIRHLAEDDKEGVMAEKVLNLFWNLAHANDVAIDIMDQALSAHIKILDYSCTQYRETQKTRWLTKCIDELKTNSTWVLPALKVSSSFTYLKVDLLIFHTFSANSRNMLSIPRSTPQHCSGISKGSRSIFYVSS